MKLSLVCFNMQTIQSTMNNLTKRVNTYEYYLINVEIIHHTKTLRDIRLMSSALVSKKQKRKIVKERYLWK